MKTWRDKARPIIKEVIDTHGAGDPKIKKHLADAYPFGERRYHPYKIWLSEIKIQLAASKRPPIEQLPLFGGES